VTNDPVTVIDGGAGALWLVLISVVVALGAVAALRYGRSEPEPDAALPRELALGDRTS
jgi:hypothetical protein